MEDANVGTVEAPVADAVANDSSSLADLVDVSPQAETEPVQAAETQ